MSSTGTHIRSAVLVVMVFALIALPAVLYSIYALDAKEKGETLTGKPSRNLANPSAKNLPTEWDVDEGGNIKWTARLGRTSYGGPVLAQGKIFVGTNNENPRDPTKKEDLGVMMCFNQSDGKFLWQLTHEKLPEEENDFARQGIASSPVVDGDYLYYVSNRAEVVCAYVNGDGKGKGKIKWSYDMVKKLEVFPCFLANCSPLIVGDLAYVVTGNGTNEEHKLPSPKAPSFLALNKKTGEKVWASALPGKDIMEGQWASPAFANPGGKYPQVIFPGGDGWLYSLEPKTGKLLWKFFCNRQKSVYNPKNMRLSNRCYFLASPVIYENKLYIGVGRNPDDGPGEGHFWCIDITVKPTGDNKDVSPKEDNFDPKAKVNQGSALVWHFGGLVQPKPEDGRPLHFGRTLSTAAIHDGLVYIAELDGYFHCLDAKTGKKYWGHDMATGIWASPYYADGKVYLGTEDGDVFVFQAGKAKKILGQVVVGPPVKTPLKADGSVLYVMTDGELHAIEKKK